MRRGSRRVGEDGFISYRLKGSQGGRKRVSVSMATEPAPCDLNVYLNARELRDVIFTPVFSSLFLPFSFVEDALGDNVILSAPLYHPSFMLLNDLSEATLFSRHCFHPPLREFLFLPLGGFSTTIPETTFSSANNVSSLAGGEELIGFPGN